MTSRSSADMPRLLAGLGLLVTAAALLSAVLQLTNSSRSLTGAQPILLLAAPCPTLVQASEAVEARLRR